MEKTIVSDSDDVTMRIAGEIAQKLSPVDCITLSGNLGSGKTTFARSCIQRLAGEVTVQSPTFLLVQPYPYVKDGKSYMLQHLDLYRIEHESELVELGLEDLLAEHACLIEWPAIASHVLPADRLDITFTHLSDHQRGLKLAAKGHWQEKLNSIYFCA